MKSELNEDVSIFIKNFEGYYDCDAKIQLEHCKNLIPGLLEMLRKSSPDLFEVFSFIFQEFFRIIDEYEKSLEKMRECLNKSQDAELIEKETNKKLREENQDLVFQNNELAIALDQYQATVKSNEDKTPPSDPGIESRLLSPVKPPSPLITPKASNTPSASSTPKTESKILLPKPQTKKLVIKPRTPSTRELSLRQLKDSIEEIYSLKVKFDEKCFETKQPRETMDQFLFTYLNQKYGLKSLISDWSVLILKSIEKFEGEDSEVALFSKILNNRVDEDFRQVFERLKETMKQILKMKIQQRAPYMRESQLASALKEKLAGVLDEDEWATIIVSMFSQSEAEFMIGNIKNTIEEKNARLIIGRRSKLASGKIEASYAEIQNAILAYDLSAHEALLEPFRREFVQQDPDRNGIINEDAFRNLCFVLGLEAESDRLLEQVDANNTKHINYSDCVNLFTYEMVQGDDGSLQSAIHSIFFKSTKQG